MVLNKISFAMLCDFNGHLLVAYENKYYCIRCKMSFDKEHINVIHDEEV
jgi:hypothetical protein